MIEQFLHTARAKSLFGWLNSRLETLETDFDLMSTAMLASELDLYISLGASVDELAEDGKSVSAKARRKDAAFDRSIKMMKELAITPASRKKLVSDLPVPTAVDLEAELL